MTKDFGLTIFISLLISFAFGQTRDTMPIKLVGHSSKDPKITGTFTFQTNEPNKTLADKSFEIGDIIKIPKILFCTGDSIHMNDSIYGAIARFLKSRKNLIVEISCHTDTTGNSSKNFIHSSNMASYFRIELVDRFKVNPTQIKARGYGGTKPIKAIPEYVETEKGLKIIYPDNNRTELKVLKAK